jgi:hypothetical protein
MKENINFYENIDEARLRLRNTLVTYDGEPYKVLAISGHNKDKIFRVYMRPTRNVWDRKKWPGELMDTISSENNAFGPALDKWMESKAGEGTDIIRKMMNSPKFNKYRPFPLGMCNANNGCTYVERQPNRKVEQGLIQSMTVQTPVNMEMGLSMGEQRHTVDIYLPDFGNCVAGDYPSPQICLNNMLDLNVINTAVGFHREFALVRGPMAMLFLAYRNNIIGLLPNSDFSVVRLGTEFTYTKEVVDELRLFNTIQLSK